MKYFIFVLQTEQLFHDIIEKGRYFNSIPLRKGIGAIAVLKMNTLYLYCKLSSYSMILYKKGRYFNSIPLRKGLYLIKISIILLFIM